MSVEGYDCKGMSSTGVGKPKAAEWALVKVKRKNSDVEAGSVVGKGEDLVQCIFNPECKPFVGHVDRIRGHVGGVAGHKSSPCPGPKQAQHESEAAFALRKAQFEAAKR